MLISRTPLRISIGGGGTDLPSYSSRHGGFCISAAITQYVFIAINRMFTKDIVLKYSKLERVSGIDEIEHPIFREALRANGLGPALEIVSVADIPAGTGLGSSGSFTVGLLRALHGLKNEYVPAPQVAHEACHIEMNVLKQPVGVQDQYVASLGGIICMDIDTSGNVACSPLVLSKDTQHQLADHLLMFFTGYSRSASVLLQDQKTKTDKDDQSMIDNLHFIKELGLRIKEALEGDDPDKFGSLMHEHWLHKQARSSGMSNPSIDRWYEIGRQSGALGGKLVGAGGGGFLLFYTPEPRKLRAAMAAEGLEEVRFGFDMDGSQIICRD